MKQQFNYWIPSENVASLKRFCSKAQFSLTCTFGEPEERAFKHLEIIDGRAREVIMIHKVCKLCAEWETSCTWYFVAKVEDGQLFMLDESKKVDFKNGHGASYGKCDSCGRSSAKTYIIRNSATGEELQVGLSCAKKYAPFMNFLADFMSELSKVYILNFDIFEEEELPEWHGGSDKSAYITYLKSDIFAASKAYFDTCPTWVSGESRDKIKRILSEKSYEVDMEYMDNVMSYIKSVPVESEFGRKMYNFCLKYYSKVADSCFSFFCIKNYENHLQAQKLDISALTAGTSVEITGRVIESDFIETYFGKTRKTIIKTNSGVNVIKYGNIEFDGDKSVHYYSTLKRFNETTFEAELAGRLSAKPKKGVNYILL